MRWRWATGLTALVLMAAACSSGPYTIDWYADSGCTADGVMQITASGQAVAVGDVDYNMISAGFPSIWCEGLVHQLQDGAEISGYVFNSEPGDALLQFEVTADGYVYEGGTGTVTDPEGNVTTLP